MLTATRYEAASRNTGTSALHLATIGDARTQFGDHARDGRLPYPCEGTLGADIVALARDTLAQLRNPSVHSASNGTMRPAHNRSDRKVRIAAFNRRERLTKLAIWLAIAAFLVIYGWTWRRRAP